LRLLNRESIVKFALNSAKVNTAWPAGAHR
jgi:hypothetical protein